MSVRFSCAVCHALFRVPVRNTVLEYASECDLIWDSGLCWADCLTLVHLKLFLWEMQKERRYYGISGFLYIVGAFFSLSGLLKTVLAWLFPLTSFEGQVSPGSWVTPKLPVDPALRKGNF